MLLEAFAFWHVGAYRTIRIAIATLRPQKTLYVHGAVYLFKTAVSARRADHFARIRTAFCFVTSPLS